MNKLFILIMEFFKTGLFAVGGGLATIPFLEEISLKYHWYGISDLTTMIAISESTPGPMGVNMATYAGYSTFGIFGGAVATLSLVAPSIIIIISVAKILDKFKQSKIVEWIFYSIRPAVVGFVLSACMGIFTSSLLRIDIFSKSKNVSDLFNYINILIFVTVFALYKRFKINPILVIAGCAVVGIVLKL